MAQLPAPQTSSLVPLALTSDDEAAARWIEALRGAGIEAELRIEDGLRLNSGSSVFPTGPLFATALFVPAAERERAALVLIDDGWDGRQIGAGYRRSLASRRTALVGAVLMAALVLLVTLFRDG